jgi:hypothetical protein
MTPVEQDQHFDCWPCQTIAMAPLIFTCPRTLTKVQRWLEKDEDASGDEYEAISCLACTRLHFVNRKTGKLLGCPLMEHKGVTYSIGGDDLHGWIWSVPLEGWVVSGSTHRRPVAVLRALKTINSALSAKARAYRKTAAKPTKAAA